MGRAGVRASLREQTSLDVGRQFNGYGHRATF
jgi:hypothetical protein